MNKKYIIEKCPFCDSEGELYFYPGLQKWTVFCEGDCRQSDGREKTERKAIENWNEWVRLVRKNNRLDN